MNRILKELVLLTTEALLLREQEDYEDEKPDNDDVTPFILLQFLFCLFERPKGTLFKKPSTR